jgi:hypothetical protein
MRPALRLVGRLLTLSVVWLAGVDPVFATVDALPKDMIGRLNAGQRSAVATELSAQAEAHPSDGLVRYQLGRIVARGSGPYLKDAGRLAQSDAPEYRLVAEAEFALAQGDPLRALSFATQYAEAYPDGALRDLAQLRMAQCELAADRIAEAEARFDWVSRHAAEPWRGFGLYGQAQAALRREDTTEAIRLFRQTSKLSHHEASAPAMLWLGRLYQARGAASESFRYLSLYREAYPHGMLPLVEETPTSSRAEAAADLMYTIQVGVFGQRANAEAQAARFRALKYSVVLKPKRIGDQNYTAVWVGRYASQKKAQDARLDLERKFDETYRVVVSE